MLIQKRQNFVNHFRGKYFTGESNKYGLTEISWHGPELNSPGWDDGEARCLAMTLGDTAEDSDQTKNVHCMFNMFWDAVEFQLPQISGLTWYCAIDTALPSPDDIRAPEQQPRIEGSSYVVTGRSVVALVSRPTA